MHILVNDFIGGVLDRGIPLYVRNLIYGLREEGFRVTVVRAPAAFRKLPRSAFYAVSVMMEQLVLPIVGRVRRADMTIYPYNTMAIADMLSRRGRIVVHDLELLNRSRFSPQRLYCSVIYAALKRRAYPVFTIANLIREKIAARDILGAAPITLLPNTFYVFEDLLREVTPAMPGARSLLLCTGSTENKDLASLVSAHLPTALADGFRVSILGLHKKNDAALLAPLRAYLDSGQLRLCGQLSDAEVAGEYLSHQITWVHSRREGFGRCLVEGRLAGRPVVCSAIPEFLSLRDDGVHFYEDAAEFHGLIARMAQTRGELPRYTGYPYRQLLRDAVAAGL
jgi:glycosyltransferase involved in cell wall biosynthesis